MNKVAAYLQGHLSGDVSTRIDELLQHSRDQGILVSKPEMVVYPRNTNDVRKVMRFAWQLAEKGHALSVSARGQGLDQTGAASGKGVSLVTSKYLTRIFEYEPKQKLVRLQPGVSASTLHEALRLHGTGVPALPSFGTVGGAVANDADTRLSDKAGSIGQAVDKLEVVLASGEVIQTGPISKRELDKRKGIQGREGDIYRGVSAILEDHAEFIKELRDSKETDRSGYRGIADVVGRGGSFDLTPLFVGSQGSLGIIVEMILQTEFMPMHPSCAAIVFTDAEAARDMLDELRKLGPDYIEYYDGVFLKNAIEQGKRYTFLGEKLEETEALVLLGFNNFNERVRKKQLKKTVKLVEKQASARIITNQDTDSDQLESLLDLPQLTKRPSSSVDSGSWQLIPGCYVPVERLEEFLKDLRDIEAKLHLTLPVYGSALRSIYAISPTLSLQKVSDKQKALKVIDLVSALVIKHGGSLVARDGEGRLLSRYARAAWSDEYTEVVSKLRAVFDPHNTLNVGVKSEVELKDLVAGLRNDNNL